MTTRTRTRLELTWIGKDARLRPEPRILLEDPALSYVGGSRTVPRESFDNRLIHGDNLLALKALEAEFTDQIKCVYIDPPFNTGQTFEHYDDGIEHSLWLDLMARRLEILKVLLRRDGVLFVHLDQEEVHYLKVLLDEMFGRSQFLGQIAYERSGVSGIGQGGAFLVNTHEYILAYAKERQAFAAADLSGEEDFERDEMKRYNRVLVDPGERIEVARFVAPATGEPVVIYKHRGEELTTISLRGYETRRDEILAEYVRMFPQVFRLTSIQKENEFQNRILELCKDGFFSADYLVSRGRREGERTTSYYCNGQAAVWLRDTAQVHGERVVRTGKLSDFWPHADIPKANLANEGGVDFRRGKKPELLVHRLLRMTTKPGDWVLDSFAGSGTTGAVAHKMGRRWIMVELGEHCQTHVLPRMKAVVDGADTTGATEVTGWNGGGGFRYLRLAPSLLERDRWGNWIIRKEYNAAMLSEAMCKHEGFVYAPSRSIYWQHGKSTEADFIYVTTQTLAREQLEALSHEVGSKRTLLVCCGAFRVRPDAFENLTLKKIPNAILHRCEWGRDDYSLAVSQLQHDGEGATAELPTVGGAKATNGNGPARGRAKATAQTLPLFGLGKLP